MNNINNINYPLIAEERKSLLLQELDTFGFIHTNEFANKLNISPVTVRRDLAALESEGLCIRKRGGAVKGFVTVSTELPYDLKRNQFIQEKKRIGEMAAKHINSGSTIILDSGSTTYAVSMHLRTKTRLIVVTNDLQISVKLANFSSIQTICTGGLVRSNMFSLQGPGVVKFINDLTVDTCFLGADAIGSDLSVTNVTYEEAEIKRAMMQAAKKTILLADSSKFDRSGFTKVCMLSDIDLVITDRSLSDQVRKRLDEAGIIYKLV